MSVLRIAIQYVIFFWCRGMRKAWVEAYETNDYKYYIWLNDDVVIYPNAFQEIFECSEHFQNKAIISGLIQEVNSKQPIYGGYDENKKLISANGKYNRISKLNGNFVIIPKFVFDKIGFFIYKDKNGDMQKGYFPKSEELSVIDQFPGTHASCSLLANLVFNKYHMNTPIYREMDRLFNNNMTVCRNTVYNWFVKGSDHLKKVLPILKEKLLA